MIVKQILAHNFVTYESLNIRFPEQGIIGIEGRNLDKPVLDTNAVGKTLILDMISYALYGEVLRKRAANIIGPFSSEMVLSVVFYVKNPGKSIIIKRERKGANEIVKIKMDGKMYSGRPRKMQPMIDQLIGIEWLTFQNCILYGDSRDSNFVYVGHSKRIEILAQIAGILHLREARKLINPDLREAEKELSHVEGKIESLREAKARAKETLKYHKERLENIEEIHAEADKKLQSILKDVIDQYEKIDEPKLIKELEMIKSIRDEMNCRKEQYLDKLEQAEKNKPKEKLDSLTKTKIQIETLINKKQKEFKSLEELEECPTCHQPVDASFKERFIEDIPKIPSTLLVELEEIRKIISAIKELKQTINDLNENIQLKYAEMERVKRLIEKKAILEEKILSIKKEQESKKDIRKEIEDNIEKAQEEYDSISNQLTRISFGKKDKKTNRDVLKYWNEKFSPKGAEAELIVDLLKKLQTYANNYIHKLTDGSISIYMTPHRETGSGAVKQEITIDVIENGEPKDFDLYSGGQKNRIEKAIRLGLMKVLSEDVGFKLFDEIGKDLSSKGYEEVIKLMREIFDNQQNFLITNDRESKKLFDHRLLVTLKDGRSTVSCSWRNEDGEEEISE